MSLTAKFVIFCSALLVPIAMSPQTLAKSPAVSAKQRAWVEFRSAYLKKDFRTLAKLSKFPIEVKGTLDDDPVFQLREAGFSNCLALHFAEDAGDSSGITNGKLVQTSENLSRVKSNGKTIGDEPISDGFQVANLVFSDHDFKLVRFYIQTAEPTAKTACQK